MVIITHCFTATGVLLEYPFSEHHWLISLMGGATAIFVFISGYFYERVYRRRLTGRELIRQRLLLLLPPYLFISLVLIACDLEPGVRGTVPVAGDPVQGLAVLLLTGATGPAMWYVPFILALLLFTPAFARFAVAPVRRQLALLLGLLLRFCRQPIAPLCALADLSFGLFFVHQPVMLGLVRAARVFGYRGEPWSSALLLWVLTVALSIAVLMLGRGLLGRRARVLLGS